jgi:hypothetical protein
MKWVIRLTGKDAELEFLANASAAAWQVKREPDGYKLTSPDLDSID